MRKPTAAALVVAALALTGCATKFDAQGNRIHMWQFGQDTMRDVDYSNPRLPVLPRWRPSMDLWYVPSPFEFNDLSRWSLWDERAPVSIASKAVGDNAACAACNDSTARLALATLGADARSAHLLR
jgi:hypothetical protein